jgi:hypothetical protein
MDIHAGLKAFADELGISEFDDAKTMDEIEALYSDIVLIIQKKNEFFDKPRVLFQREVNDLDHDVIWKHLPVCLFMSFASGNIKDKLGSLLSIVKNFLSENPSDATSEISRILTDENAQSSIEDFIEFCTNTRIAKVLNDILTNLDVSEFEGLLENPREFIEIARNPEHPIVKKFIQKFQNILKEKMERGEISQSKLQEDIEGIKAKLTGLFGNALTEALGGRGAEVPSAVLTSNSPEARRQRMLARLQRKQREKTQR